MNWEEFMKYFNQAIQIEKDQGKDILKHGLWEYVTKHSKDRIEKSLEVLEENITITDKFRVHELGYSFPLYCYPIRKKYNCYCLLTDIAINKRKYDELDIFTDRINICTDEIGNNWDLIICTEVLEHLPCNLYKVRDKIIQALKIGGYLLISIHLGDLKEFELEEDISSMIHKAAGRHIKEFPSPETVINFFNIPNIQIIDHKKVYSWGDSYLMLIKRIK